MSKESEIRQTIESNEGVPPFTVWTSAFLDIIRGEVIPNSGMPPHKATFTEMSRAIIVYINLTNRTPGKDIKITQEARIDDSTGKQVYP